MGKKGSNPPPPLLPGARPTPPPGPPPVLVAMSGFQVEDKIRFKRELSSRSTGDHPSFLYARRGETGQIVSIGGCWEGYWVKTDSWETPFGCEEKDFESVC